jgi:transposase InsO family protein
MCRVLRVSTSGYYAWRKRPISRRRKQDEYLIKELQQVHSETKENYGAIKAWKTLKARGIACGKHRAARLRRKYGIVSKRRKRFKITTMSKNTQWIAPNLLNRSFKTHQPNQIWVGDVTYIATKTGWLYLAILLNLYSRKVIGWSMSDKNNKELVAKALEMALMQRRPSSKVLHHTDRGAIYGSDEYRNMLIASRLVPSMSRKGDCYDNAVAESFFSTLKNELIYGQRFNSKEQARSEIFKFIEIFYNRQRLHQTLDYKTPDMMEQGFTLN